MTAILENPAEPVVEDDGTYGGYSDIARMLNSQQPERERPYSRQLVHKWYTNRGYNGFPAPHPVRAKSGKVKFMFAMAAVETWHRTYRAHRRGQPVVETIDTIPLFHLSPDGLVIW